MLMIILPMYENENRIANIQKCVNTDGVQILTSTYTGMIANVKYFVLQTWLRNHSLAKSRFASRKSATSSGVRSAVFCACVPDISGI